MKLPRLTKNDSPYQVIEDFLTKEECKYLLDEVVRTAGEYGKPFFRGSGLYSIEDIEVGTQLADVDPTGLLKLIIDKVEHYYKSTHEMHGEFVFNRIYGNIMDVGAYLPYHRDEDPNPEGVYDGKKRSHVCSLLLNDDYEGGELVLGDDMVALKPKPGSLVLFPGYYVPHKVNKITKGSRVNILVFFYDILA
jgi:hypothetical protein